MSDRFPRKSRKAAIVKRRKLAVLLAGLLILLALILAAAALMKSCEKERPYDTEAEPERTEAPEITDAPDSGTDPAAGTEGETSPPDTAPEDTASPATEPVTEPAETKPPRGDFAFPEEMASRHALLIDLETWEVIAEKDPDAVVYPASITKIMTVLLAVERLPDPDMTTSISAETILDLISRNAARAGFEAGEQITVRDLEAAALLPSGADAAVALAELISGSEEAFADLMNARAAEIGMKHTHFVTCTGLHRDAHVSSCSDLALLVKEALKNEAFRAVFELKTYRTSATPEHPWGLSCESTMLRGLEALGYSTDRYVGGKTGYTPEAGLCLASVAKIDGKEYLLITLTAGTGSNQPPLHVMDADLIWSAFEAWLAEG